MSRLSELDTMDGFGSPIVEAVREFYRVQVEKGLSPQEAVAVFDPVKTHPTGAMLRDYASRYGHLPFNLGRGLYTNQLQLGNSA